MLLVNLYVYFACVIFVVLSSSIFRMLAADCDYKYSNYYISWTFQLFFFMYCKFCIQMLLEILSNFALPFFVCFFLTHFAYYSQWLKSCSILK